MKLDAVDLLPEDLSTLTSPDNPKTRLAFEDVELLSKSVPSLLESDRSKDVRSPRIYFMLGNNGFIYPLFFDPYHEINP